jgi:glycosyltransferase involved in cell wall biosynthesis
MKYSIIIPVRNGGDYLKECVASILAQTYKDFTLHILENDSTDGTKEWLSQLTDPRIIIKPSSAAFGIEENWSRIVSLEKNEFMTVIGYDDLFHPDYLESMDQLIAKHPAASLYQGHFNYINQTGAFVRPCLPMDEVQHAHEFIACHFCRTLDSMGSGYMMRSKDYDALGGIPPRYPNLIFADYELWIRLTHLSYKATDVKTTFSYRLHESVSKQTNGMLYQEAFGLYIAFIKQLIQQDEKVRQVVNRYGKDMLLYFCESLSHRLLKTPKEKRSVSVREFVQRCEGYAREIIPDQDFRPLSKFRIKLAGDLDASAVGRGLFTFYKKIVS